MSTIIEGHPKQHNSSITLLKAVKYATPDSTSNQADPLDHPATSRVMEHKVAAF